MQKQKEYDNILKTCRITGYENRVKKSDNKMKCMWAICREITSQTKQKDEIQIERNGEEIANKPNDFLVTVVPNLFKSVDKLSHKCNILRNDKSIFLKPITPKELCELATNIKNKHSCGIEEIPASIMKIAVNELQNVLRYLINNCFIFGIFPNNLKVALIKPLYKKGSPELLDSYRPISLLPAFSKLIELAMCNRIVSFMNMCNLFNDNQHGYLKGKSTQTAIFQFIQSILNFYENGSIAFGIFIDLSKAYDRLDREILLKKQDLH